MEFFYTNQINFNMVVMDNYLKITLFKKRLPKSFEYQFQNFLIINFDNNFDTVVPWKSLHAAEPKQLGFDA
jgi:hypothetical protein